MSRRKTLSQSDIKAILSLIVIAVAVIVIATVGVYLVIAGIAIAVGWLIKVSIAAYARYSTERERRLKLAHAEPAFTPFLAVGCDTSPVAMLREAPRAFDSWIKQFPFSPRHTADLIRDVCVHEHRIARLETVLERRSVVARSGKSTGRHSSNRPSHQPGDVDAWGSTSDTLRDETIHSAECAECSGAGRVSCERCSARGRLPCSGCHGVGKAYGHAKNGSYRLMNCKDCKARGFVDCVCVAGYVICAGCDGVGRVDRWLTIESTTRLDVESTGSKPDAQALPWLNRGDTEGTFRLDAESVSTSSCRGTLPRDQLVVRPVN